MSVADYASRKVDVLAFRTAADGTIVQSFFDDRTGGEVCVGIRKLAQRVTLEFLTIMGSMPFLPDRGSTLLQAARSGALRTEADVQAAFAFAAEEVRRNLVAEEYAGMPDDERYGSTTLNKIILSVEEGLALSVIISSRAGDNRAVILPLGTSFISPF